MPPKKVSPDALCPCGSGRKYQDCCCRKGLDGFRNNVENGRKPASIQMTLAKVMDYLRRQFTGKHRQEVEANDPVAAMMPHGEIIEHLMVQGMKKAGIPPALIYAFEKTGVFVTADNITLMPDDELNEWRAAVREYEEKHRQELRKYPLGVITCYGFDDTTTTKITATVFAAPDDDAGRARSWMGSNIVHSPEMQGEVAEFVVTHGVKTVVMSYGNVGCPHEEGLDYPTGEDCPFCPFWEGKQGNRGEP